MGLQINCHPQIGQVIKVIMLVLKKIIACLVFILFLITALFLYYIHTPGPELPTLDGDYSKHSLMQGDLDRSYSIYQPKELLPGAPVIFVLHGSRGSGDMMRAITANEFDQLADKHNMVIVYPDGFDGHWNDCRRSADYEANQQDIDDPSFLASIIDMLVRDHSVDRQKVFATGVSNGGHMVYRLAMEKPDMYAAFASMAANLPVATNLDCTTKQQAVSIAIFNGSNDPVNPYGGGLISILGNDSRGEVLSSEKTANYWLTLAGISGQGVKIVHPETDGDKSTSVIEQRWVESDATEIRLYTLKGSGHVIPSKIYKFPRLLGGDAGDVSGPREIVEFFLGTIDQ